MSEDVDLLGRVSSLRRDFDASFAEPAIERVEGLTEILAVTIRGADYGLHLEDVLAVATDKQITRVPSPSTALLGLAGFRGRIVSVYDLGALVGERGDSSPRWVTICAADPTVALAFEEFVRHIRTDRSAVCAAVQAAGSTTEPMSREVLRTSSRPVPIVSIAAVLSAIRAHTRGAHLNTNRSTER